jgi:hypothetical protein
MRYMDASLQQIRCQWGDAYVASRAAEDILRRWCQEVGWPEQQVYGEIKGLRERMTAYLFLCTFVEQRK